MSLLDVASLLLARAGRRRSDHSVRTAARRSRGGRVEGLVDRFVAGDSVADIAYDSDVSPGQVEDVNPCRNASSRVSSHRSQSRTPASRTVMAPESPLAVAGSPPVPWPRTPRDRRGADRELRGGQMAACRLRRCSLCCRAAVRPLDARCGSGWCERLLRLDRRGPQAVRGARLVCRRGDRGLPYRVVDTVAR
jgi:hypothetical protein